jgi:cytochrome c oxidase subunit 5a
VLLCKIFICFTRRTRFSRGGNFKLCTCCRYENFFNRKDIDGWEIRQGINDLCGHDLVPEPKILTAALKACRRVNDYALAVRILEAVKDKCGGRVNEIYPYLIQEIRPALTELGIDTPEELGYDKPELALQSVYEIH